MYSYIIRVCLVMSSQCFSCAVFVYLFIYSLTFFVFLVYLVFSSFFYLSFLVAQNHLTKKYVERCLKERLQKEDRGGHIVLESIFYSSV